MSIQLSCQKPSSIKAFAQELSPHFRRKRDHLATALFWTPFVLDLQTARRSALAEEKRVTRLELATSSLARRNQALPMGLDT
jgi:hypothetical protein